MQTRRTAVLSGAAAALFAGPRARAAAASPPPGRRVRVRLPAPGGPYAVGSVELRLVDAARRDPWTHRGARDLMASVRYPARPGAARRRGVPQLPPGTAAVFARTNSLEGVPGDRVDWAATRTHARRDAPPAHGRFPVVLYSPGAGDPRGLGSTLCDDLASRGYVVVCVDHTYDAVAVEFPGGRVETTVLPAELAKAVPDPAHPDPAKIAPLLAKTIAVRVADVRFVADRLPDALPGALRDLPDPDRLGVFGHSAGGFTALEAMAEDGRFAAGANFDGVLAYVQEDGDHGYLSRVASDGLDRPFLLAGKDGNSRRTVPSWDALWRAGRGPRHGLTLRGAQHATFTDAEPMVPQIARALHLPDAVVTALTGTVSPRHAVTASRAYLAAFFDRHLLDRSDHGLLERPTPRYPDVRLWH